MAKLVAGIDDLDQKNSANTIVEISQPLPSNEALFPYIEGLRTMVSDNNLEALNYLDLMEERFGETPIKELLIPVKDSLRQYKFDQANSLLSCPWKTPFFRSQGSKSPYFLWVDRLKTGFEQPPKKKK